MMKARNVSRLTDMMTANVDGDTDFADTETWQKIAVSLLERGVKLPVEPWEVFIDRDGHPIVTYRNGPLQLQLRVELKDRNGGSYPKDAGKVAETLSDYFNTYDVTLDLENP